MESDLTLTLKKKKEMERRTDEYIQDAKHSSVEEFKASPAFAEEMARAIEVFRVSEEYRNNHVTFNEKIFHQTYKEGWADCRKLIEEEHQELNLAFLDYEDEEKDGKEIHAVSKLPAFEKEKVIEPPSFSTTDVDSSKPSSDMTLQVNIGD